MKNLINKLIHPGRSLKRRTIQGFVVIIFGDAYMQALRFLGNLAMTRLLFPEAFGLMLIVNTIFAGLGMMSDAGVSQAVISKGRGRGPEYLNTAWTIMCIRGGILCLIGFLLAWPLSLYYEDERLIGLIFITAFSSLIGGFNSPNQILYDRDVKKAQVVFLDAATNTFAMSLTLVWLWMSPTIWALAGYGLMATILKVFGSYRVFKGDTPRFCWNKEYAIEIIHFGKWILLSTAMTFLATQGDRIIAGNWMTAAQLGVYAVAIALAKFPDQVAGSITWRLLFPVYSELKEGSSNNLVRQALRVQFMLYLACMPFILGFALFGSNIVELLYDDRYIEAGWTLQVLAIGATFTIFNEAHIAMMLAHGHSAKTGKLQFVRVMLMILLLSISGAVWGKVGLIYAIAASPALFYLVLFVIMRKYNSNPKVELSCIGLTILLVSVSWSIFGWPGVNG